MKPKTMDSESDVEDEMAIEEPVIMSRLAEPLRMSKLANDQVIEFAIATGEEIDQEEDTDMLKVYSYDDVEPYILTQNQDVDSDDEGDVVNPILPFSTYQKKMECLTDDGKVKKLLEKCGMGPTVKECGQCVVFVHYAMYNDHEECPYDVSRLRQKKPIELRLAVGGDLMTSGMIIAIKTMRKGEKSKFLIEPEDAYGEVGVAPRIQRNVTILADIELIDFTNIEDIVARYGKNDEIQKKRTFKETFHCAEKLRHHGNKVMNLSKNLNEAIRDYRRGVALLKNFHYENEEEEEENTARKLMLQLYTNLCMSYNAKTHYRSACVTYKQAVEDCPGMAENYPKLLYQSAKALRYLGHHKEAVERLKRALKIKPDDEDILRELDLTTNERDERAKTEKNMYKKMFGFRKNESSEENDEFDEMMRTVSKDFKEMFVSQIDTMMKSDQDSKKFSFGATPLEKDFCQKWCKKNNLSFRVTKADGVETFIVTKKS